MKSHFRLLLLIVILLVPFAITSRVFGEDEKLVIKGEPTPTPTATLGPAALPNTPVITSVTLQGEKEYSGVRASIRGTKLFPSKGDTSVSFPGKSGSAINIKDFHLISDSLLIFDLPEAVGSGNVTVTVKSELGTSATSKPYPFEFHSPEILFVTGEDGIGPGKKIKIWGNYFDGIYYRDGQRSLYSPITNGKLVGADTSTGGNLSVIEISLPEGTFQKDFWVERNCDDNGENCLKSNTIKFSEKIPPLLTEIQPDYMARTANIFGKNFPEDEKNFQVTFGSSRATVLSYDYTINKAVIELPCPLETRSVVNVKANGVTSNSLIFVPKDSPQILDIKAVGSRTGENRDIEVSINIPKDIKATSACNTEDNILTIGSKTFPLTAFGGIYAAQNILMKDIPTNGDAKVVINGVESPAIAFSKESFNMIPHIYSIEGKLGFRPGVPFVITGRNFSGVYKACGDGDVSIKGPEVYFEQKLPQLVGYDDEGEPKFKDVCEPIPPTVTSGSITAQFAGVTPKEGTAASPKEISVSVGSDESNVLSIPFGSSGQKAVFSNPEIRSVEYPYGHNVGDEIIIRGSNFGMKPNQNLVTFGSVKAVPTTVNARATEMRVTIPEGAGAKITVTRTQPDNQISETFEIQFTSYPDEKLSFTLSTDMPKEIDIASTKTFDLAKIAYINSIGDLQINRFRVVLHWKEADPKGDFSITKLKIPPFEPFTLKLDGKIVAGPVTAEINGENLTLVFPPFKMPLTTSDDDTLTISSKLASYAQAGSKLSLQFTPSLESEFLAVDINRTKGVRPENKDVIITSEATAIGEDTTRCLDTDKSEVHCQQFFEQNKTETAITKDEEVRLPQEVTSIQKQKKIQSILAKEKLKTQEKTLLTGRARVLDLIRKKVGEEVAAKIEAALIKNDQKKLESFSDKLSHENSVKLEQRKTEIETDAIVRKKAVADALLKKVAVAERLPQSRLDTDKDGLSDSEEELLGTDSNAADTDGDGYSDFLEIEFGYSPTDEKIELIYSDLKSAGGAASAISRLTAFHIISGYDDGTYRPATDASRAQFLSGIIRIFYGSYLDAPKNNVYSDVLATDWFAPEVALAKSKGYLSTAADYTFRPYEAITRLEACDLTYMIAGKSLDDATAIMSYGDLDASTAIIAEACISDGLLPSVATSLPVLPEATPTPAPSPVSDESETTSPTPTPTATATPKLESFKPDTSLTRAEMAVMILRALRLR